MDIKDLNLSYYELELFRVLSELNQSDMTFNGQVIELGFRPSAHGAKASIDTLLKDINLMNSIREQSLDDPAIKEAFDQLLTVMALKK